MDALHKSLADAGDRPKLAPTMLMWLNCVGDVALAHELVWDHAGLPPGTAKDDPKEEARPEHEVLFMAPLRSCVRPAMSASISYQECRNRNCWCAPARGRLLR
jgi:hypothetical protein